MPGQHLLPAADLEKFWSHTCRGAENTGKQIKSRGKAFVFPERERGIPLPEKQAGQIKLTFGHSGQINAAEIISMASRPLTKPAGEIFKLE